MSATWGVSSKPSNGVYCCVDSDSDSAARTVQVRPASAGAISALFEGTAWTAATDQSVLITSTFGFSSARKSSESPTA